MKNTSTATAPSANVVAFPRQVAPVQGTGDLIDLNRMLTNGEEGCTLWYSPDGQQMYILDGQQRVAWLIIRSHFEHLQGGMHG